MHRWHRFDDRWDLSPPEAEPTVYLLHIFGLRLLRDEETWLDYDYVIWLDADAWFTRHRGHPLRALCGTPVHASLESDACAAGSQRPDWWNCPLPRYTQLMRLIGVQSRAIFNVNAGFLVDYGCWCRSAQCLSSVPEGKVTSHD